MKKILFVIDKLKEGGAEKILLNTVRSLDKKKYDITVVAIFDGGKYVEEIKRYCKYIYIYPEYIKGNMLEGVANSFKYRKAKYTLQRTNLTKLYKDNIKEKYDVEVAFLEGYSAIFLAQSANRKSKKIVWIHTDVNKNYWSEKYFKYLNEKDVYSRFNQIVCVSKSVQKSFVDRFKIKDNVSVKYNIIDENLINRYAEEMVDENWLSEEFRICSIGRLEEEKNYKMLFKIHKKLIEEGFKYKLILIGDGSQRDELQNFLYDHKLEKTVELLGFKDNPYKYLKKSDLFVCSSLVEGFSTVVTEAIILGVPVVTTNCAGMEEQLGDSKYGIITENNEQSLYRGVRKILQSKEIYDLYKQRVKERSKSFTLAKRVREIERILDE